MRSVLISPDTPEWSRVLADNCHDIYSLPAYVSLSARYDGGEPAAVFVEDGSARRLLLPLVIRDLGGGRRDAVSPYGYPGAIVDAGVDAGFVEAAMTTAIRSLASEGVVALFVRLHPLLPIDGLDRVATLVNHGETVVIDLSLTEEQMWRQTRQNHRRDIARAQRNGGVFAFERAPEALEAFKRLYRATMERRDADDWYKFDDEYFDDLVVALEDRLHLATVRIDGNVAAAGLFSESCGIVQLYLSGSHEAYDAARPTKLLYDGVRRWAKRRQARWFHLGGGLGAQEDSLLHFKSGFSSLRRSYMTLRAIVREDAYRSLVAERRPGFDPSDLTGFFPVYSR